MLLVTWPPGRVDEQRLYDSVYRARPQSRRVEFYQLTQIQRVGLVRQQKDSCSRIIDGQSELRGRLGLLA